jgi:hypothetical protein
MMPYRVHVYQHASIRPDEARWSVRTSVEFGFCVQELWPVALTAAYDG